MQPELPFGQGIGIVRLGAVDSIRQSKFLQDLLALVEESEGMYPNIRRWLRGRVIPGLKTGERAIFMAYRGTTPIASAIVKRGVQAKLCHLKISEGFKGKGLGELLMTFLLADLEPVAEEIHFTLPESLWESRGEFFESFGFGEISESGRQYRLFDRELRASAPFSGAWSQVIRRLPKIAHRISVCNDHLNTRLLMSLKPRNAESILNGEKTVEVRRRFSSRWVGHYLTLYASGESSTIVGSARIANVIEANPSSIWSQYGPRIGCSEAIFQDYTHGSANVFAIELEDVHTFERAISLSQLSSLLGSDLHPPQSYCSLTNENSLWSAAVSLATILQASKKQE